MAVVATNPKRKVECLNLPVSKKRRFSSSKTPLSSSSSSNPTMATRSAFAFHAHRRGFLRFRSLASSSVLKRKKKHRDSNVNDQEEKKVDDTKTIQVSDKPFLPLNEEEKAQVERAFSWINREKVLVSHKQSNLDIIGKSLQCLMPSAWLNDEVVNFYLELLKEREARDPQKYLKCHFFNSFFYTKLLGSSGSKYNYQAVRRWTIKRKLGYDLIDCHIIFVPIHEGTHWTLAVINIKERKFMYLDSLAMAVPTRILNALAKYLVDEVKDKSGKDIDVSSWDIVSVENLPQQHNGYIRRKISSIKERNVAKRIGQPMILIVCYLDCVRGYQSQLQLELLSEDMPYFRLRTAKEILRLQAD
ncbi:unnamed protein product [Arabis nemorensis]|uniref:Ubiquitin-like protease family profile domain-containing protein n=1 Tax=Arabis nemorensis TaxID=586526 RepID=A0A565CSP2_9BRAS|nr:unnamed protein product [Arabis nemorensis]